MKRPESIPPAVRAGVERYARQHAHDDTGAPDAEALIASLEWDPLCGCYGFSRGRMWIGVELDGHVHT